jgi:hypothetical protein
MLYGNSVAEQRAARSGAGATSGTRRSTGSTVARALPARGIRLVGVSAQRAGVHSATGLRAWSPTRYGALEVTAGGTITDDSLSYDIVSQAVRAVRSPAALDPMGTLPRPKMVIATGHSQSAGRLATYYNAVQPLAGVLDAVVLHGGGGVLRTDLATKVFRINSEGDVAAASSRPPPARRPTRRCCGPGRWPGPRTATGN